MRHCEAQDLFSGVRLILDRRTSSPWTRMVSVTRDAAKTLRPQMRLTGSVLEDPNDGGTGRNDSRRAVWEADLAKLTQ
jgi:hypothetical protein